jgi:hypothetical protein
MAGDVHGASGGGWFPSGWGAVILSLSFHYRQGHGLPLLLAEEVAERLLDFFRCLVAGTARMAVTRMGPPPLNSLPSRGRGV